MFLKMLFSTFLFILLSSSWVFSDELDLENKHVYHLKCFQSNQDCTLFESKPQPKFEIELEEEPSSTGENDGGKIIKRKTDMETTNSRLQNLIKRFFNSGDKPHAYKADEINCLTGDCKILTAKIGWYLNILIKHVFNLIS